MTNYAYAKQVDIERENMGWFVCGQRKYHSNIYLKKKAPKGIRDKKSFSCVHIIKSCSI